MTYAMDQVNTPTDILGWDTWDAWDEPTLATARTPFPLLTDLGLSPALATRMLERFYCSLVERINEEEKRMVKRETLEPRNHLLTLLCATVVIIERHMTGGLSVEDLVLLRELWEKELDQSFHDKMLRKDVLSAAAHMYDESNGTPHLELAD